jgi:FlaA1/EpsC-like NDP-sugar epimerase
MFNNSRIFISGATGSWGRTLIKMLLANHDVKEIVCFSRGELAQVLLKREINDKRLRFIIGDVRDLHAVTLATKGIDYIFHLAALKHVPICEDQPDEVIKTNILGTQNIISAAIQNQIIKVINVSSDKACEPVNMYGMTKAIGERLILQANNLSIHTRFVCIRGGNVMGSSGSVIPFFIEQIKNGGPITITDKKMTRFFLTLEEAITLLFEAVEVSVGGEMFVMRMPAGSVSSLASILMSRYGTVPVIETGIRPGEKLEEVLVSSHESYRTRCWNSNYYVILPPDADSILQLKYHSLPAFPYTEYSSNTIVLTDRELGNELIKGKFV